MMTPNKNPRHRRRLLNSGAIITSLFLGLAFALSIQAKAANDMLIPIETDLASIVRARGYDPADIRVVMVTTSADDPNTPGSWQSGIVASSVPMLRGSFGIAPDHSDPSFTPEAALRFRQGFSGLQGIVADTCAGGHCKPATVEAVAANRYIVRSEGFAYTVNLYGALCAPTSGDASKGDDSCTILIPSWSLAHLAASGDGSMPYFPKILGIAQLSDRLLLVNLDQKKIELDLKLDTKNPVASLGRLRTSSFYQGGQLVLNFENGAMVLDLAEDMVVVASADGTLFIKDSGLGRGDLAGFTAISDPAISRAQGDGRLLAFSPHLVITNRSAFSYTYHHDGGVKKLKAIDGDGTWQQAQFSTGGDTEATILSIMSGGASSLSLTRATMQLKPLANASAVNKGANGEFRLVAGQIYLRRGDGWLLPSDQEKDLVMAIPGSRLSERLLPTSGSILIQRSETGQSGCDWTRHKRASDTPGSYREDGSFRIDCGERVEFNLANTAGAEAAVVRGKSGLIKTYLFVPGS